jgi:glycosyltransferase involved in cell wall biosynthesis
MGSGLLTGTATEITVIIPVFNSAEVFPELYGRLSSTLRDNLLGYEIIAVIDGCKDNSFSVINQFALQDPNLKIIEFSRNFGHQAAVTAGLQYASARHIAVIDDDLEDPPELIPEFLKKIGEGFDVVYGIRRKRQRSLLYRVLYRLFYRVSGSLSDISIPNDAGDFCVMTGRVRDTLLSMPENNRYLRGMRAWVGFRQTGIEYSRDKRFAGQPGYSLRKYIQLAFNGIFSFSYRPLKYVTFVGLLIALASFEEIGRIILLKLNGQMRDVPGWTYLTVCLLFLSGIQLTAIGIVGEYIARIYDEVKQRPKFVISAMVNLEGRND